MPLPESIEQLRSFLRLATFIGQRFIPHFSSLTANLFSMCSNSISFEWTDDLLNCFNLLRNAIAQASKLVWFDVTAPITIVSDASNYGLGAALMQNDRVVAYASRKLTGVETRYSCIEREFLGILFALNQAPVAQWVLRPTHTRLVPGSKHDWCKSPLVFAMIAT